MSARVWVLGADDPEMMAIEALLMQTGEEVRYATMGGVCFVSDGLPGPDGRVKTVCQSGTPEQIAAFMGSWAPAHGLTDIYGDPARGFAGGDKQEDAR